MLEVKHLSRKYGHLVAVDDVSFSINKGEIVGLLGHNGAGKTTIMKMISGYLEANKGTVTVDRINLEANPKTIQKQLGYLPENLPVYPEMTVADYLDYAADLKGLKHNVKKVEIKRVVKATDLSHKLLAPIATLSRGLKQRVGVAQAILGHPKLLILDEPTNGLDPEQTQQMRALIRDIAKDATVILSTHIMQEVEALCSRVLIVHGGKLALDAELDTLRQSNHLLLETSLALSDLEQVTKLPQVVGLDRLEAGKVGHRYRIECRPDSDQPALSAQVAQFIASQNAQLYLLQPELRDLETLFKQVSTGAMTHQEVCDAAA
ncbi:ABC transporter ATP-binding protein [Neiella sp. HB171785]|uniref:ABC transporter ATP-binding protein n=1 Tax=Neiella litorisoli TaxID=2771431 RepID=A0A8J6R2K2_9GAMM|nr:ABC transporter ATP-binding protein [Neiella litorisoli]MBD1388945.1 ABC transporter ATP-binding protein [Neiella litorisoli]